MFFHRVAARKRGIGVIIAASRTNANLFQLAGSPAAKATVMVTINAGVIVGSSNPALPALDVGQFPAGSTITIDVYGEVQGAGGAANGGVGGTAIKADYPNQTVTINIKPGGKALPGGGGGGKGGTGGAGGTGGQGYYETVTWRYDGAQYYWGIDSDPDFVCHEMFGWWGGVRQFLQQTLYYYDGSTVTTANNPYRNTTSYGSWRRGSYMGGYDDGMYFSANYYIGQSSGNTYTSGGTGGGGGGGGNGGRGQGYDGANAAGTAGSAGSTGAAGGTNAGVGGTGGTGGGGGTGGIWGANGNNGATGNTGGTGANGNYTAGTAGAAGAAGSAGGLAGYYLLKGTATVTFNNSGTIAGRLG